LLDCSATKVLALANRLPVSPHDQPRVARFFSLGDLTLMTMAELLIRGGFDRDGATAAVSAMASELMPLTEDENRESWLIVWNDPDTESGIDHQLVFSKSEGLDVVFAHENSTILTVRPLAERAMSMILAADIAENEDTANG
jgi:hypothetical protein